MKFIISLFILFSSTAFAGTYWEAGGSSGMDSIPGRSQLGRAPDGSRGSYGNRGGDGQNGRDGGDATLAKNGDSAGNIIFRIQLNPNNSKFAIYNGSINGVEMPTEEIELTDQTQFVLNARGGRGGSGAPGGNGQNGGNGGKGGDASSSRRNAGDGGRGGDGGQAGKSTNGANGGRGGNILILLPQGQDSLLKFIKADVSGGQGGIAPAFKPQPGRGGEGGQAGNNCYYQNGRRECGSSGSRGSRGRDGSPVFANPAYGYDGAPGRLEVRYAR